MNREPTEEFFQECIEIDPLQLTHQFSNAPSYFAYWAEQANQARAYYAQAKADREFIWAKSYLHVSATAEVTGKKVTVDAMKAHVEISDDYRAAVQAEIEAEASYERARTRVETLRLHRDMLIQCGALTRQEMQHDPTIRDTVANANRNRNQ